MPTVESSAHSLRPLLWAVALLGACLVAPTLAPAASASTIRHFGVYSFASLGGSELKITESSTSGRPVVFSLPPGASERDGHWYVLHLHAVAEIAPDTGAGRVYLNAGSGAYGSAKILLIIKNARQPVAWSTVGALNGYEHHESVSRRVVVRYSNIFPLPALHAGKNTLWFDIEHYGAAHLQSLTIYADSAIEYTSKGPGKLELRATTNRRFVAPGQTLVTTVELTNGGDRSVRAIKIKMVAQGAPMTLTGSAERARGQLRPGQRLFESFALTAQKAGATRLLFLASSTANQPGVEVNVVTRGQPDAIGRSQRPGSHMTIALGGAGLLGLLAVAGVAFRHRRRRHEQVGRLAR